MNKTLLLADDDDQLRNLYADLISDLGYTVHSAKDGQQAKELLEYNHFDLAILDNEMPYLTGIDICRHVHHRLPVIIWSGGPYESQALEAGARMFLAKSQVDIELLENIIADMI